MKLEKISNYVLYGISVFIVLSFLAFFLIGYDNMEGDKNAPKLTVGRTVPAGRGSIRNDAVERCRKRS